MTTRTTLPTAGKSQGASASASDSSHGQFIRLVPDEEVVQAVELEPTTPPPKPDDLESGRLGPGSGI
ncbi:MAG TPA: hypothetical protein VJ804_03375 [Acidimicrobiales bacterium]|nr:hypothetical protein [Acidimicrobiales bacterium]